MSVIWMVMPIDPERKEWLADLDIEYPEMESRLPTGDEILEVLNNIEDCDVVIEGNSVGDFWGVKIIPNDDKKGFGNTLCVKGFSNNENVDEVSFDGGRDDHVRDVVKKMVSLCGPLILVADVSLEEPEVIKT